MAEFRKRPVVVEAFRWTADHEQADDPVWIVNAIRGGSVTFPSSPAHGATMRIQTLEGPVVARRGDWIVRGVEGELYPCKDSVFRATYDEVVVPGQVLAPIAPLEVSDADAARFLQAGPGLKATAGRLADIVETTIRSMPIGDSTSPGPAEQFIREGKPGKFVGYEPVTGPMANEASPKAPTTKWSVEVHLGVGSKYPVIRMQFSEEMVADNAFGIIQKRMAAPANGWFTFTFRHDGGVATFFATDVRAVQKHEFKDYGDGEDF